KLLDKMLSMIGLRREDVYITNVVKCRPVGPDGRDRTPVEEEVKACSIYLKQQLLLIEPELVVVLGSTALNYFVPGASVQRYRGRFVRHGSFVLFVTYHPAAAFYKPELREAMEEDFRRLGSAIAR
ncbi:MAG: uracil-DNA glycosylase, partial [Thermofilum sp.]